MWPSTTAKALPEPRWEAFRSFSEGSECRLYEQLGAHEVVMSGERGFRFSVWAPNAKYVSVIGDFNHWDKNKHPLQLVGQTGVWEGFVPGATEGARYKYYVVSHQGNWSAEKGDPMAFWCEEPPRTASIIWKMGYEWGDSEWIRTRAERQKRNVPLSIYEFHPGSWMRVPEESNRWLHYRELAAKLVEYVQKMQFTHVEILPIVEHPFYASWGYQPTGYYAPTSRYGTPQDLMYLVDTLHQNGIGIILDWAMYHFPNDLHALSFFDGSHIYAHPDSRRGYHPSWKSAVFDYSRPEVRSFLLSSALFWLEKYHMDGLRVDAVSYMLYHNYYRKPNEWLPNQLGGSENLDAVHFLRQFNDEIHRRHPGVITVAEEATTWPKVSQGTRDGGLGFDYKWDMGWMNDTLQFVKKDGHRRGQDLNKLTFRMMYAFSENFMLALSHDEVVHLKGSLWNKMWGNPWEKYAGLRMLFGYMYAQPGKKLLFMGGEFAQQREWNHDQSLDWHLLNSPAHAGVQKCVQDLNMLYRAIPALHRLDDSRDGFEWVACDDKLNAVFSFLRKPDSDEPPVLVVCNLSAVGRRNYRVGVPRLGVWKEIFNSDAKEYGGAGVGNFGGFACEPIQWNGRPYSLNLTLPPLSTMFFLNEPVKVAAEAVASKAKLEKRKA